MSKVLYSFYVYCGRMGDLEGVFVATQEKVDKLKGKTVYFHEVLGKHSEIEVTLSDENLTMKSTDEDFIGKLIDLLGYPAEHDTISISGTNPFEYYYDEDQ